MVTIHGFRGWGGILKGHRRVANDLLEAHHPRGRPWTALEFLLLFDGVATRGEYIAVAEWARDADRSRVWVRARISEYLEAEPELRKGRRQASDTSATPERQAEPNKTNGLPKPSDSRATLERQASDTPHTSYRKQETRHKNTYGPTTPPEALSLEQLTSLQNWCAREFPNQVDRVEHHAGACFDHFRGTGKRKTDWIAVVRNWIRNDHKWKEERSENNRQSDPRSNVIDAALSLVADRGGRSR